MEVDSKEEQEKRLRKKKFDEGSDESSDDEVVSEFDVVVCESLPNTEMFCVQFPKRRQKIFESDVNPRVRFKKNVRMMEMRFTPNVHSGSYDRAKVEKKSESPLKSPTKPDPGLLSNDEVFEGRAFNQESASQNVVGKIQNGALYLSPIAGIFDMHRIVKGKVTVGEKEEDEDSAMDSDSDAPTSSKQLRVKFTRPETERQKKRREASALHRQRMIASDHWLPMDVHLSKDAQSDFKMRQIIPRDSSGAPVAANITTKELAQIICGKVEQLDLTSVNQSMSYLRIKELPLHLQVKAQVMKARVISMTAITRLVEGIDQPSLISALLDCAHLVQGVWVLRSEHLFHGLPPAHSNVPGKVDENRSAVWRNARDLTLCLLSAELRVNRLTLSRCFHLNTADAEEILQTVGEKAEKTWKLLVAPDLDFLNRNENLEIVIAERRYWVARWQELKQIISQKE